MGKRAFGAIVATALAAAGVASAADKPLIAPPPAWVRPSPQPTTSTEGGEAAVRVLLSDSQVDLQPGRTTVYTNGAFRIQTPQGLAAGNLSFSWRPDVDVVTVHKLLIRRGGQTIDVLASGQTFTVVRREQNLESAMLDGVLTANIQPEGLQVGDVIEFAASVSSSDPTLKGHVEQVAAAWNLAPIGRAHLRVQWPASLPVRLRQTASLPALKSVAEGGLRVVELSLADLQPVVPPKDAPTRYRIGRLVEVTDFASWADVGALMAPLYDGAAIVPAQGPLRTELERIRALSPDPKARVEAALALVEDRVRYVALAMGVGGYVPAGAETTWVRRYGDCKGKTVLLLALLRALNVQAEPVAVSSVFGDGLDGRLPLVGLLDHVLVRATVAGRTYWLDGTRTGDAGLDRLTTPNFGWGVPLVARGAPLVRMTPTPLDTPLEDDSLRIDASAGVYAPAPVTAETVLRGDAAIVLHAALANLAGEAREQGLKTYWKDRYDSITVKSTAASWDAKTGEQRLTMTGDAKLEWTTAGYEADGMGVGYRADLARAPGPAADAPFTVAYPTFTRNRETILLPKGHGDFKLGPDIEVDQTAGGIAYRRHATLADGTFTIEKTERSLVAELPAKDAPAAQAALRALADRRVFVQLPVGYAYTRSDASALAAAATPTTSADYLEHARLRRFGGEQIDADLLHDLDKAIELDPANVEARAFRAGGRLQLDDVPGAKADLAKAQALAPAASATLEAQGAVAQHEGRWQDAVDAYTKIIPRADAYADFALEHRALAYKSLGQTDAALSDSTAALKLAPGAMDLRLMRMNIFLQRGRDEDAVREAAAAEAASPDSSYAHVMAGNLYGRLRRRDEAMGAYQRALAIKPEAYIYVNRALNRPRADLAGRRSDLDAALKLDPDLTDALLAKAVLQIEEGDPAGAVATYSTALRETPDNVWLLAARGAAYSRAGDAAHAEADFAAARAKATKNNDWNNLCWAKATAGVALASALSDCDAALAKAPGAPGFLDSRGLVLLRLGRFDDAIADYDQALAKAPSLAGSHFGRAVAWARKGDRTKADADIATALKLNPDVRADFKGYGVEP